MSDNREPTESGRRLARKPYTPEQPAAFADLTVEEQVARLRHALDVLASWLVEAQTGFGANDAKALQSLIEHGTTRETT